MRPREFDHYEVLRVAFEQFWRKGVRGTSLADIAREADVQRGSLYNAYGSKEALFLAAYERYAGDYLALIEKVLATGSLRKRLTAFFDLTIKNFPWLLKGATLKTSPNSAFPIRYQKLRRFNNGHFTEFGNLVLTRR